jgi:hypothetical protein
VWWASNWSLEEIARGRENVRFVGKSWNKDSGYVSRLLSFLPKLSSYFSNKRASKFIDNAEIDARISFNNLLKSYAMHYLIISL